MEKIENNVCSIFIDESYRNFTKALNLINNTTDKNINEIYDRVLVISDENVYKTQLNKFIDLLNAKFVSEYIVPAGEESKCIDTFEKILEHGLKAGLTRKSLIIAVGGGVVGDLSGYVAASYMRGIDFVQVPTTLLAQVDSSIGGKTGINLGTYKNVVGAFYQPQFTFINVSALRTLPDREFRNGMSEVVKYGFIYDYEFINYLLENQDKVKGLFITHGHEDHIGSIPYILKQLNMDIYATRLTIGLIASKLEEHNISKESLRPVKEGDVIKFNKLSVEFIRATHSIADACSLAIFTPLGTIVHTGDFKIDYTPIDGRVMDLNRLSALGEEGVLLLMADSTNVERSGHSLSEKTIGETLNRILDGATGRVIVATFASNIHRMQQIVDASLKENRKICFSGRSMENVSKVAMELGYLHIPEEAVISVDELNNHDKKKKTIKIYKK